MPRIWNVLQQRAERRRIREQYEQMLMDQKEYPPPCNNNNNNNTNTNNNNNNNNANKVDEKTEFTVQFIKSQQHQQQHQQQQQQQQIEKLDGATKSDNDSVVHSMEGKKSTLPLSQPHGQNRRLEDDRKVIDDADHLAYNDASSHYQENSNNPVVRNILDDLSHTAEAINNIISYDDQIEGTTTNIIADTTLVSKEEEENVKVCGIVMPRTVADEIFDGIVEEDYDCSDNRKESNTMLGSSDNSYECSKMLNTTLDTLDAISDLSDDEDEDEDEGDCDQIDGRIDSFRCLHQHHLHHNHNQNCFRDLQIDTIEGVAYEEEGEDDNDDNHGDPLDGPDNCFHPIQQHPRSHNRIRDVQADMVEGVLSYEEEEERNHTKTNAVIGNEDDENVFAIDVQQPSPQVAIDDEIFDGIEEVIIDRVEHVKELTSMGSVDDDNEWSKMLSTSPETITSIPRILFAIERGSYEEDGSHKEEGNSAIPHGYFELDDCDVGEGMYSPNTALDNQERQSYDLEEEEETEIHFAEFGSEEYTTTDDEQIRTTIYEHAKFIPSLLGTIEGVSYEEDDSHEEEGNSSIPQDNSELYDCDVGEVSSPDTTALDNQVRRSYDLEEEEEEEEICFEEFRSEHTTTDEEYIQSEQYKRTTIYEHTQSNFWRSIKKKEIQCGPLQATHQKGGRYQDTTTTTGNEQYLSADAFIGPELEDCCCSLSDHDSIASWEEGVFGSGMSRTMSLIQTNILYDDNNNNDDNVNANDNGDGTYDDTIDGTVCSDDDNIDDVENKNDHDKQSFVRLLRSFRDMNVGNQISDTNTRSSGDEVEAYDDTYRGSTRSLDTMFERLGDFGIDILNGTIEHAERLNTYPSPPPRPTRTRTNQSDTIMNTLADLFSC